MRAKPVVVGLGMTLLLAGCGAGGSVVSGAGSSPSAGPTSTGPASPVPTPTPTATIPPATGPLSSGAAAPAPASPAPASPAPASSGMPTWATASPRPGVGSALVVTPRPGMSNVHTISWTYALQTGSQTVRVYYYAGIAPCTVLDHVDVAYHTDTIVITLYTGSDPSAANRACIALARSTAVDVTLNQPANGRSFVDGSTGKSSADGEPAGM